jgi:hypothetical protein
MKKIIISICILGIITLCGILLSCTSPISTQPPSVLAAPNDSIVTAKVISIDPVPGSYPWQLTIQIEQSLDVPGFVNRTSDKIGQQITALTNENLSAIKAGQKITAHVKFQADEKGGTYYASGIK